MSIDTHWLGNGAQGQGFSFVVDGDDDDMSGEHDHVESISTVMFWVR